MERQEKKVITTDNYGQLPEIFLQIMKPLSEDFLLRCDFGFASIVEMLSDDFPGRRGAGVHSFVGN